MKNEMSLKQTLELMSSCSLVISRFIGLNGQITLSEMGCNYIPNIVEFRRENGN